MKPYFETELGKLYHGDCLEIMPQLEPVDLVIADIPYNEVNRKDNGLRNLNKADADTATFSTIDFVKRCNSVCTGCIYVFCGTEQVSGIRSELINCGYSTRLGFWEKSNPSPMNGEYIWLSGIECFVYGKKPGAVHNVKCKNPVFRSKVVLGQIHPTQKPISVISEMVEASSLQKMIVLDPCHGSGTTAVACEQLNRRWIGIEISEKYCEIAAKRIERERQQLKMFGPEPDAVKPKQEQLF